MDGAGRGIEHVRNWPLSKFYLDILPPPSNKNKVKVRGGRNFGPKPEPPQQPRTVRAEELGTSEIRPPRNVDILPPPRPTRQHFGGGTNFGLKPETPQQPRTVRTEELDAEALEKQKEVTLTPSTQLVQAGVQPCTLSPQPWTLNPEPGTLDLEPCILNPRTRSLNSESSRVNP